MLKILYACSNNSGSKIQLSRFLKAVENKDYIIKIAAYKNYDIKLNIDWTLDCLHSYFSKSLSLDNEYFTNYLNQIKLFNPDLIISDLEYFTSYAANHLDIPLWQCSSLLVNSALIWKEKYGLGINSKYKFIAHKKINTTYSHIINNSDLNLVYSHFGDLKNSPDIVDGFEWVRPYTYAGKKSTPCKHNIVAGLIYNNKKIINSLNKINDCVAFSPFTQEKYKNLILKNINDDIEYGCNITNCELFLCEGQTNFLADAFYNNKFTIVMPNLNDIECIINCIFSEYSGLSKNIYSDLDINKINILDINSSFNKKIHYLHERIERA